MDNHRGLNNKLAETEAWTCLLKQEAGVANYLEMSHRCVDPRMRENQEAALPNLERDMEQKGRGREQTPGKTSNTRCV